MSHPLPSSRRQTRKTTAQALLGAALCLLMLSSCATDEAEPTYRCPRPGLVQSADRLVVFDSMSAPTRETVTVKAEMAGYTFGCTPVPRRGVMEFNMTLSFAAERTQLAGDMKGLTLPYFIAVIDPQGRIVTHQRHKIRLRFGDQDSSTADRIAKSPDTASVDADHEISVAAPDALSAGDYRITFGFELIPAQLRYNQGAADLMSPPPSKG